MAEESNWGDRNLGAARTCWDFSWEAYSIRTDERAVLWRRLCMWTILGVRTLSSVVFVLGRVFTGDVLGVISHTISGLISFFFIAWCLAQIGEAEGSRTVFNIAVVSQAERPSPESTVH
jgi:hypothetical protein